MGSRIQELAPRLYDRIPARVKNSRTVYEAITSDAWARDLGPAIDHTTLEQFLSLWPAVAATRLNEHDNDAITWA